MNFDLEFLPKTERSLRGSQSLQRMKTDFYNRFFYRLVTLVWKRAISKCYEALWEGFKTETALNRTSSCVTFWMWWLIVCGLLWRLHCGQLHTNLVQYVTPLPT